MRQLYFEWVSPIFTRPNRCRRIALLSTREHSKLLPLERIHIAAADVITPKSNMLTSAILFSKDCPPSCAGTGHTIDPGDIGPMY